MPTSIVLALTVALATPALAAPSDPAQADYDDEPAPAAADPACHCAEQAAPMPAVLAAPVKLEPPVLSLQPPRDVRHDLGVVANTFLGISVGNALISAIGVGLVFGPGFGCGEDVCTSQIAGILMSTLAGAGAIGGLIATVALYAVRARYRELPRVVASGRGSSLSFSF
jgi:hypothetical protein